MKLRRLLLIILFSFAFLQPSHARSRDVPRQFQKEHPCPSTGRKWGACPGYVRDHIKPLCAGGADATGEADLMHGMAGAILCLLQIARLVPERADAATEVSRRYGRARLHAPRQGRCC